ncbi:MAG: hypothetical protein R3B45_16650 [Bdellovibrionota bacterium]
MSFSFTLDLVENVRAIGIGAGATYDHVEGKNQMMSYEKLDVYQCSIKFLSIAIRLTDEMPRGHGSIA